MRLRDRRGIALLVVLWALAIAIAAAPARAEGAELRFTILHTNDEHAALWPRPAIDYVPGGEDETTGGFARLAGALRMQRNARSNRPVLTVNAGDFFSGSPFSWLASPTLAPELDLLAEMDYDVVILGNHEFDFGPTFLAEYLAAAGYPGDAGPTILAGNAEIPTDHPLASRGIVRTHVVELGEEPGWDRALRIGFFSLLGEAATTVAPEAPPVTFADPVETAEMAVSALRDQGADVIIAVTHSGVEEDRALARQVEGIHLIVGGHCHTALHEPVVENGVPILQAGSRTEYLGIADLVYDTDSGSLRLENADLGVPHLLQIDSRTPEDPRIARRVEALGSLLSEKIYQLTDGDYADVFAPLAALEAPIDAYPSSAESPMGRLVSDAFRWKGEEILGRRVDVAFQASGQIRGGLSPGTGSESEGLLSVYDLLEQVGLGQGPDGDPGAPLVGLYFTGGDILRILEISQLLTELIGDSFFLQISGLRVEYDPDRAVLLHLPILDLPVPTYRSVLSAHPVRNGEVGPALDAGDDDLYLVVGDYYVASFLPRVGAMLPRLAVEARDARGHPLETLDQAILRDGDGREVKGWRAVMDYATSFPIGLEGYPVIPPDQADAGRRLVEVRAPSHLLFPLLGAVVLIGAIWAWRRHRIRLNS